MSGAGYSGTPLAQKLGIKESSKVPTDITEDTIRDVCLPPGYVDVKVCAVDAAWCGLKLVLRKS